MTKREFLNAIVEMNINEELATFAADELAKMDKANEARREKNGEKAAAKEAEKAPIREAIFNAMTDEPKTATTLIEEAGLEIKPQSIPSLVRPLVEAGKVNKVDVKVVGKGKQRGYVRA